MTAAALACRGVTVRHGGKTVLDVPELAVAAGETLAVIGPNGAGKSTLLGVLGLTQAPTTGVVTVDGEEARAPATRRRLRRRVLTQLQDSLLLDATVAWNVALPLRIRGLSRGALDERVTRWTQAFGVERLLGRRVAGLSGGEARRVCLARAFAAEPDALLVDEPLAGVDGVFREEILSLLVAALGQRRSTTLMVTHDLGDGLRLADRLAVLVGGRIRQLGRPADVLHAPADPDVAAIVGAETYLPATGTDGGVRLGGLTLAAPRAIEPWARVWVAIRPEDVELSAEEPAGPGCVAATVVALERRGATVSVALDAGFKLRALVLPGTVAALGLAPGRRVWARVAASIIPGAESR